jgi:1-acyl-sn-glycerol-3-phosphate acyltransferase
MVVPPLLVRRVVLAPLVFAVELAAIVASPLLALAAALASPLTGGAWRPLRVVAIAVAFLARHLLTMLGCLALWVAGGFGVGERSRSRRILDAHHELLRWFVSGVNRQIRRVARVEVDVSESAEAQDVLSDAAGPVIVLSRHAGEGDSLLVLHELLVRHRRRPRVVLHEALRLEPLIDILGHRLPNRFVDPRGGDTESEIAALAADLGAGDALLIFPEGGNFSRERRRRGIERLERGGYDEEAAWARKMRHVSAPRPGGALAAIAAAPAADVVFVGHVGTPVGLRELWSGMATGQTVEMHLWLEPAAAIPTGEAERIDWLFGWWCTLDAWIDERA